TPLQYHLQTRLSPNSPWCFLALSTTPSYVIEFTRGCNAPFLPLPVASQVPGGPLSIINDGSPRHSHLLPYIFLYTPSIPPSLPPHPNSINANGDRFESGRFRSPRTLANPLDNLPNSTNYEP